MAHASAAAIFILFTLVMLVAVNQYAFLMSNNVLRSSDVCDDERRIRREYRRNNESDSIPDGLFDVVDDEGRVRMVITYRQGIAHGPYTDYWLSGSVATTGQYVDGRQHSLWTFFDADGEQEKIIFDHGKERTEYTLRFLNWDANRRPTKTTDH